MAHHWLNIASQYVDQMQDPTATGEPEENKQEQENTCWWRGRHGKWSEKRAVILSKPETVLEADLGAYIIAEIEV